MENNQYQRDKRSNALINTDVNALKAVKLQKEILRYKEEQIETRFRKIEETLAEIMELLKGKDN